MFISRNISCSRSAGLSGQALLTLEGINHEFNHLQNEPYCGIPDSHCRRMFFPRIFSSAGILRSGAPKKLAGREATEFINNLHFQAVAAEKNEIGFYEGESGPAIIYVSYYTSNETAAAEGKRMSEKISPENSVFIGGEYLEVSGKAVYRCFGMGQTHFVFTHQKALFWMSVNTMKAKAILAAYLEYLGV